MAKKVEEMTREELQKEIKRLEKVRTTSRFYYDDLTRATNKELLDDLSSMLKTAQSRLKTKGNVQKSFQEDLFEVTGIKTPKNVKLDSLTRAELQKTYAITRRYLVAQTSTKTGQRLHDLRIELAFANKGEDKRLTEEQKEMFGYIQSKESFKNLPSQQLLVLLGYVKAGNVETVKTMINEMEQSEEELTFKYISKKFESLPQE